MPANDDSKYLEWVELKKQIVAEVKKDALLKSVAAHEERRGRAHQVSRFFQHPAVLVLLTFVCTSWLGSYLTSSWQGKQLALQEKYQITDQLNRGFAEYATAAEDILSLYTYEDGASNRQTVENERWEYWQKRSREWRILSNVIRQKLNGNFKTPQINETFSEVKETQYEFGVDIKNMKVDVDAKSWETVKQEEFQNEKKRLLGVLNGSRAKMATLLDLMMKEIENE